jgi:predicted membrane-bound mannosyltransferase
MADQSSMSGSGTGNDRFNAPLIQFAAFAMIVAFAALLRFWHLGVRTFHPDESVYSLVAAQLARGASYEHLPVMHGPLHYMGTAAIFSVFGDSDFTARALPAIFGVALAALPFMFTRHIGRVGAIAAALLLAVSPSLLYYSRFAGPEIYLAFFTAALAMLIWHYLMAPERAYLYLIAAVLAFMFVSTEMALVVTPIFVAYLAFLTACDLLAQMADGTDAADDGERTHYDLLGVTAGATDKDIRGAYRKLIDATESRTEREAMAHAYGVLTNANRRAAYDRKLARMSVRRIAAGAPSTTGRIAVAVSAPLIAIAWPVLGGLRARLNLHRLPVAANPMIVIALLAAPFYGPLVQLLPFVRDRGFDGQQVVYVIGGTNYEPGGELPVMLITLAAIVSIGGVLGWMWRWNAWVICWATFYGITAAMFTGFFTNQGGIWTGYWGTLDFWMRPEADITARAPYYYGTLLALYDFLPAAAIAIGAAALAIRGSMRDRASMLAAAVAMAAIVAMPAWVPFFGEHRGAMALMVACATVMALRMPAMTKFLAFWAVGAFFAFAAVPEKQPWLMVHVTTPVVLLAGKLVNDAIAAIPVPQVSANRFRSAFAPRLVQASIAASFAGVALFTLQTGVLASWGHGSVPQLQNALALRDDGDTPIELIQPDQTSPDVREVRDAITRAGIETGLGTSVPVAVDSSYSFAQTWLWYLRDYDQLTLNDMRRGFDVPADAVVLVDARNRGKLRGAEMALSVTYTQQWAFPYSLERSTGDLASELVSASAWSDWMRYATDRPSIGQLRTTGGVAYFPRDLVTALPPQRASDVLSTGVGPDDRP